jgi:hypothetical protein
VNRDNSAGPRAMNDPMLSGDDLLRLRIVDNRNFDDVALFGDFPGRCGDFRAERSQRFARFVAQIVDRKLEAGFGDVRRHGLSHRAQTYKTNLGLHRFFLCEICSFRSA